MARRWITVLHLDCGLDSRVFRIDPLNTVRWYDVDMPDVIELRKRLYLERHDYTLIGSSVTALHWLDGIPADRPVLVVAESLDQYLSEKESIALFNRITEKFPAARKANVSLPWGINDPREFEKQVPRLKLVTDISFLFIPELVERLSQSQSWAQKVMYRTIGHITFLRRSILHLRYRF